MRREETLSVAGEDERTTSRSEPDLSHLFFGHRFQGASFLLEGSGDLKRFVDCQVVEVGPEGLESGAQERLPSLESPSPGLAISFRSSLFPQQILIGLTPFGGLSFETRRRLLTPLPDTAPPANFLRPGGTDATRLSFLWDRIALTPEENYVVEALKIIEPEIERIAFLGDERRSRRAIFLKLAGSDLRLPLGSVGDGLKYLLALALNLIPARGGFLFVDEIDTGLHYSVMADMWRFVIEAAKRLDVQVFATTHSLDCVHALSWVWSKAPHLQQEVMLHRVERGRDHTVTFTMAELATASKNHIEVR
jgi:hypothetical protein